MPRQKKPKEVTTYKHASGVTVPILFDPNGSEKGMALLQSAGAKITQHLLKA